MKRAGDLFRFLASCADRGEQTVLVTLTDVTGSAARAPGEHMAVSESGQSIGSFSGGCVEAAVIAEAQDVIAEGRARHVRYGVGSRYIDIRLPCGGGIDLLFTPMVDRVPIDHACTILDRRDPVTVRLAIDGGLSAIPARDPDRTGWQDSAFLVRHDPVLRVLVLGHGAEPAAMLDIARAYGADVMLLSPQASLVDDTRRKGIAAESLRFVGRTDAMPVDRYTAVVTLFHDHDWETALLLQALEQDPFYVGAMGSRQTHVERQRRLLEAGGDPQRIARIVGPVGLIKATRDPQTLALSIMAQLVDAGRIAPASAASVTGPKAVNDPQHFSEQDARTKQPDAAL